MSIVDYLDTRVVGDVPVPPSENALHRLGAVRRLQGISRRTLARRMNLEVADIRRQEDESSDLTISILYEWQRALDVPVAELLVDSTDALSEPLLKRAQLVRLMKTALALLELADSQSSRVLAQALVDLLKDVMPELQGVGAWNVIGRRRRLNELGVAASRMPAGDPFMDMLE